MSDQPNVPQNPLPPNQPMQHQPAILNQTLGQLLQSNPQAQNLVMQSMGINPQQFEQMLQMSGNNQMMNQTIGDLFKNGTMQQAMQVNPQQIQQMLTNPNGQMMPMQAVAMGKIDPQTGQMIPLDSSDMQRLQQVPGFTVPQKPSLMQKIKSLFR
jgi:hypothetical protein